MDPKFKNPQFKNSKMSKIQFFLKYDLEVLRSWGMVQILPECPNCSFLSIWDTCNKNFNQRTHSENLEFCHFSHSGTNWKVIPRVVLSKNSYLKVIPLKSSGNVDAFCTINEYAETYRSKYTFYSSQLILLENCSFKNPDHKVKILLCVLTRVIFNQKVTLIVIRWEI